MRATAMLYTSRRLVVQLSENESVKIGFDKLSQL